MYNLGFLVSKQRRFVYVLHSIILASLIDKNVCEKSLHFQKKGDLLNSLNIPSSIWKTHFHFKFAFLQDTCLIGLISIQVKLENQFLLINVRYTLVCKF